MISSFPVLRLLLMLPAIYFNFLSARIFMISNCYLDTEGESVLQDSPPIFYEYKFSIHLIASESLTFPR